MKHLFNEMWDKVKAQLGELAEEAAPNVQKRFNIYADQLDQSHPVDTEEVIAYKKDQLSGFLAGYCDGILASIRSKRLN